MTSGQSDTQTLDRRFVSGVAWSGLSRGFTQLFSWAGFLVVARIMTPTDFGVVAAAATVAGFVALVAEFGLGSAIVALPELTDRQIAQLTGVAVLCGVLAWALTASLGMVLPTILRVPELRTLLPVVGISIVLSAANAVPIALLRKRLEFRQLSMFEMWKALVQAAFLLGLALLGFRYWSFIISEIAAGVVMLALVWRTTRPGIAAPVLKEIIGLLRFTRDVLITRIAWYAYSNADFAVVSRQLGKATLGDYSVAWTLVTLPNEKVATLIYNVTPSIFAKVQNDVAAFRRYVMLLMEGLSLVLFPASAGIAVLAPDLVPLLLGPQWSGAVPIVQALAGLGAVRGISPLTSQIFISRGRAEMAMYFAVATAVILPLAFLAASPHGPVAVACMWITVFPVLIAFQVKAALQEIEMSLAAALSAVGPSVLGTSIMCAAVFLIEQQLVSAAVHPVARLAIGAASGVLVYIASLAVFARHRLRLVYRLLRYRTLEG